RAVGGEVARGGRHPGGKGALLVARDGAPVRVGTPANGRRGGTGAPTPLGVVRGACGGSGAPALSGRASAVVGPTRAGTWQPACSDRVEPCPAGWFDHAGTPGAGLVVVLVPAWPSQRRPPLARPGAIAARAGVGRG